MSAMRAGHSVESVCEAWLVIWPDHLQYSKPISLKRVMFTLLAGLNIGLPARPGSLPFPDCVWPPQPRPADVPVWLGHLMAGHIRADSGRRDTQEGRDVIGRPPVFGECVRHPNNVTARML
jgi:hypothetical protein